MEQIIKNKVGEIERMLIEKNRSYGNSALDPVRILSKASPQEQLLVRMDDKLSRIVRGDAAGEDTIADLVGYAVLYAVSVDKDYLYLTQSCASELISKINKENMTETFISSRCEDLKELAIKQLTLNKEYGYKMETFLAEIGNDLGTFDARTALLLAAHFLLWSIEKDVDNAK